MTRTQAFIELLESGISAEDATELLDALERESVPTRKQNFEPDPLLHQPVSALMNRSFGIVKGFKIMFASENGSNFDIRKWENDMEAVW